MGSRSLPASTNGRVDVNVHNMQPHWTRCSLASLALSLLLISSLATAAPKSRSSKLKFQEISSRYGARGYSATCKEAEPCGWALYTPGSSPRKIYKYTKNIFCSCSGGDICSLTRDALQQNSFVFYCRSKESSRYRQAYETSTATKSLFS